jgi:penicillin-binding protein 1B
MSVGRTDWIPLLIKFVLVCVVVFGGLLIYLDATVRHKFEGKRWDLPGQVFARPLELYVGKQLLLADFVDELNDLSYGFDGNVSLAGHAERKRRSVTLHTRGFEFWDKSEKARVVQVVFDDGKVSKLHEGESNNISLLRLEPVNVGGIYPIQHEDRIVVRLQEVPELLKETLLVVEDRNFYTHAGIKLSAIARAMLANVKSGELSQGGSTVTQQLVKNMFLSPEKSLLRKLTEVAMAGLLELHYEKWEILETYLNEVYLAQDGNRAIHGFGLASEYFFAKPIAELELHEIALLVGIIKGPSYFSPQRNPDRAKRRRDLVIDILVAQDMIDNELAADAKQKPLLVKSVARRKHEYPAYIDLVKRQLARDYKQQDLTTQGLRIFTNLDPVIQRKAQRKLTELLDSLAASNRKLAGLEGAVVVTSAGGGEIKAIVGGRNVVRSGFNRALDAVRPVGSLIKPVIYLTALENDRYTLASSIDDGPIRLAAEGDGPDWQPRNYDRVSHGKVTLLEALTKSYNQATVRLGLDLGIAAVLSNIEKLGVNRNLPAVPALLLGAGEMSPLDVAGMYHTIASGGFLTPLKTIREVVSSSGTLQTRYPFNVEQVVDSATSYLIDHALREVFRTGTASVAKQYANVSNMAGKTGTTNDLRDSWFAGYGNQMLSVVWLGHDGNQPTTLTGSSGALRVWSRLMAEIALRPKVTDPPSRIVKLWIDSKSGARTTKGCAGATLIPFKDGTEPASRLQCSKGKKGIISKMKKLLEADDDA